MSTKAEIESNITTQMASGNSMPISDHRGVLKDDTDNILDNFYPDFQTDTQSSETFWDLTTPGSCDFNIQYAKQGSFVTITGVINNIASLINELATIQLSEFNCAASGEKQYGFGFNTINQQLILLEIQPEVGNSTIHVTPTLSPGDTINFSITYLTNE